MAESESKIYHERQRLQFCLLHSLNNLFQDKDAFTRESLNSIAEKLVTDDPNKETWTPLSFLLKPHHNTLTGNYDVNVMITALEGKGKSVVWHDKRSGASLIDLDDADTLMGIVLNVPVKRYGGLWRSRHWVVVRKINGVWYNLDSDLVVPQLFKDDDEVNNPQVSSKVSAIYKATGTKRFNANTRPVTPGKQSSVKGPYGKNPGCTTSCGLRLPRKTECTAARLIRHLSCKFVLGLRLVVMRKKKKKRSPPLKKASSSGISQPSVISVVNDNNHRSDAIEDCIQFINSSSSFTRSSSDSGCKS
ncbi:unnamed protein product [Arabidopsis arenosa]|uniref:ubiquitinyl hydrolase 1 n=1 Tax=Arabidopsis arenosa TaxID=38785 RepID=A0A8S2A5S7_ARAAE|nr:unnamed protein product [Arabidopsis arenosa]